MRTKAQGARRLVVKVGSALVTNNGTGLDKTAMTDWARQIAALRAEGRQVVLVSSGAIAAGMQRLGWTKRPHEMHQLQAAAAVGQMGLAEDNDTLGALVANLIEAEALIILTDQSGLYTADPRRDPTATLVSEGRAEDPA